MAADQPPAEVLQWTEPSPPNDSCSYDHCGASTPFGVFSIQWKSWKGYPGYTIEFNNIHIPCSASNLDEAKQAAAEWFGERLREALASQPPAPGLDEATVERVARAIAVANHEPPSSLDDLYRDSHGELMPVWTNYNSLARAAILAFPATVQEAG